MTAHLVIVQINIDTIGNNGHGQDAQNQGGKSLMTVDRIPAGILGTDEVQRIECVEIERVFRKFGNPVEDPDKERADRLLHQSAERIGGSVVEKVVVPDTAAVAVASGTQLTVRGRLLLTRMLRIIRVLGFLLKLLLRFGDFIPGLLDLLFLLFDLLIGIFAGRGLHLFQFVLLVFQIFLSFFQIILGFGGFFVGLVLSLDTLVVFCVDRHRVQRSRQ